MSDTDGAERGSDLFEQWLAHREGRLDAAPEHLAEQTSEQGPEPEPVPEYAEAAAQESVQTLAVEARVEPLEPVAVTELPPYEMPEALAYVVPPMPDHNVAAASVLAALRPQEPAEPEPLPSEVLPREPAVPAPPTPLSDPVPEPVRALPQTIFFKPRGATQRILGLLLLVFLALTAGTAWWAYHDRSYTSYAIAGIAAVVTAIIWATRTSATPTRLTLHGSELEIVRHGSKALFDLAHVQVQVVGQPDRRGWKLLILRRSMSPYVIDSSMVDPRELTYVLRFFHPEI